MGKGSGRRPPAISDAKLEARWAAAFGVPAGKTTFLDPSSPVGFVVGVDTPDQGPHLTGT